MTEKRILKSSDNEFGTPQEFFNKINDIVDFEVDVCALEWNKKLDNYYSPEDDGLRKEWGSPAWCNPPYSRTELPLWIDKARKEVENKDKIVCLLIPVDKISNRYFNKLWDRISMLVFVDGRIKFEGGTTSARAPSMLVFLGPHLGEEAADKLSEIGKVIHYFGIHNPQ